MQCSASSIVLIRRRYCIVLLVVIMSVATASPDRATPRFESPLPFAISDHVAAFEYLGTGQAWGDVDGDGCPDLYVTGGDVAGRLLIGDCAGGFVDATTAVTALAARETGGASFADYDNDGDLDLYVLARDGDVLLQNDGTGVFSDVSAAAGIDDPGQGQTAAWGDFDRDGDLDLYVVNWFYRWRSDSPLTRDGLYRNDDGRFTDISNLLTHETLLRPGFAASWGDFDNDGDLDLYVVNDKTQGNALWRNDGAGCGGWCFTDVAPANGAFRPASGMGLATGDYDNDGDLDFYYSGVAEAVLLENMLESGTWHYVERSESAGVSPDAVGWGAVFRDFDNDGWLDIYLATMNDQPDSATNRLYINNRAGGFVDASAGSGASDPGPTVGVAAADYDLDGRIDLLIGNMDQDHRLLRNIHGDGSPEPGGGWLRLELVGGGPVDTDALGTRVQLHMSDGAVLTRESRSGSSIGAGDEIALHFGLGASTVQSLTVRWLDGTIQQLGQQPSNAQVEIRHPRFDVVLVDGFESLPGRAVASATDP